MKGRGGRYIRHTSRSRCMALFVFDLVLNLNQHVLDNGLCPMLCLTFDIQGRGLKCTLFQLPGLLTPWGYRKLSRTSVPYLGLVLLPIMDTRAMRLGFQLACESFQALS